MESELLALNERIRTLEARGRSVRFLAVLGVGVCGLLVMGAASLVQQDRPDVLRVRGIVIEDAQGVERVVMGAPVAGLRTKSGAPLELKVFGITINDESGVPRVVLSSPAPSPRVAGKTYERRTKGHGITLYDPEANERGGLGYLDDGSVVFMTDHAKRDAAGAVAWPNGAAEVRAAGKPGLPTVSLAVRENGWVGLYMVDGKGKSLGELALVEDGKLMLRLTNAAGEIISNNP